MAGTRARARARARARTVSRDRPRADSDDEVPVVALEQLVSRQCLSVARDLLLECDALLNV